MLCCVAFCVPWVRVGVGSACLPVCLPLLCLSVCRAGCVFNQSLNRYVCRHMHHLFIVLLGRVLCKWVWVRASVCVCCRCNLYFIVFPLSCFTPTMLWNGQARTRDGNRWRERGCMVCCARGIGVIGLGEINTVLTCGKPESNNATDLRGIPRSIVACW